MSNCTINPFCFAAAMLLSVVGGIAAAQDLSQDPREAKLLFQSGFEGVSLSGLVDGYQHVTGEDAVSGYRWPPSILGSSGNGVHVINGDRGRAIKNSIVQIQETGKAATAALFQRVNYDIQSTQSPYQINYVKENPRELFMRYRMKIDDTSLKGKDQWRAIWEYKTDDYEKETGFRMIAFIATDLDGRLHWQFQGDTSPQMPVWNYENHDLAVPREQWFDVEYFVRWSKTDNGYASMKVNGQLVADHNGPTTSNAKDLDFIMLTQIYGNSYPMHQWIDDIEIWDGVPLVAGLQGSSP